MEPAAPWSLAGESLLCVLRDRRPVGARPALPWGLGRVPGPLVVAGLAYSSSPVGPYLELAVAEPARLGLRPGWCVTTMVVDSGESRLGSRANWGFPKQLGTLVWRLDGDERELRWVERGLVLRGRPGRVRLPFLVPVRALQRRSDGPVVVPGRLRGRAHLSAVTVEVSDCWQGSDGAMGRPVLVRGNGEAEEADDLSHLAGRHRGMHVSGLRLHLRPARTPTGLTSTLLAPLRAPEPALSCGRVDVAAFSGGRAVI